MTVIFMVSSFFNLRDNLNSEESIPFPSDRVESVDLGSG